jgi:putative ABC transport system substrate-binding protein
MRRREFITLLGGAAAWPLAARAQQPTMPLVGFLSSRAPSESADLVAAFRQGLAEAGYVEGQNVSLEFRWGEGRYERLAGYAVELVRRAVTVIVTAGGDPAAQAATATIPIVFVSGVASCNFFSTSDAHCVWASLPMPFRTWLSGFHAIYRSRTASDRMHSL